MVGGRIFKPRLLLGSYEAKNQRAVASVLPPGRVCWDIGANVGYPLVFADLAGPTGQALAFESLPSLPDLTRLGCPPSDIAWSARRRPSDVERGLQYSD